MEINVRPYAAYDEHDVIELDAQYNPYPWSELSLRNSLEKDIVVVATTNDKVVGFAIFFDAIDALELLLVVTSLHYRRRGVAKGLLKSGLDHGRQMEFEQCLLEVRVSNSAAIGLYESMGFQPGAIRKNYYNNIHSREDAMLFSYPYER